MTTFLFTKRAAAELDIDTAERGSVVRDVLERVVALAKHSETDVSNLMQTAEGQRLVSLNVADMEDGDPDRYSSDWDSVVLATPEPLTDAEHERVLLGEDRNATGDFHPVELYGARIKINP
jgi:hypothetical protein